MPIAAKAIKVGVAHTICYLKKAIYWQDKNGNTANNNHLKPNTSSVLGYYFETILRTIGGQKVGLYYSVLSVFHLRNKDIVVIFVLLLLTSTAALILVISIHPANASTSTALSRPHVLRYAALGIGAAFIIAVGVILYMKRRRSISSPDAN